MKPWARIRGTSYIFPVGVLLSSTETKEELIKQRVENLECAKRINAINNPSAADLEPYLGECAKLQKEEDERRQGVESRLTSILGLSSIAGTIVFSEILALAAGTISPPNTLVGLAMAFLSLYLAMQICSAILATVRGLESRGCDAPLVSDLIPVPDNTRETHLKKQIGACAARLGQDRFINNEKVSQMQAAHQAIKNFVWVLMLTAMAGFIIVATTKPTNALIRTLKNNHELNELLRGPEGPKGDPGPPGPKGETSIQRLPTGARNRKR